MEEIAERIKAAWQVLGSWIEYAMILLYVTVVGPFVIVIGGALILTPILYPLFALRQSFIVSLYMFAVFAGVTAFVVWKHKYASNPQPHRGRGVISDRDARVRARSRLSRTRRSDQRRPH